MEAVSFFFFSLLFQHITPSSSFPQTRSLREFNFEDIMTGPVAGVIGALGRVHFPLQHTLCDTHADFPDFLSRIPHKCYEKPKKFSFDKLIADLAPTLTPRHNDGGGLATLEYMLSYLLLFFPSVSLVLSDAYLGPWRYIAFT